MLNKRGQSFMRGIESEYRAANFFQKQGYEILNRRLKTPYGEIDLIVANQQILIFIEVKQRQTLWISQSSLTHHQQKRLCKAALWFLAQNTKSYEEVRFDLIAYDVHGFFEHLVNVFDFCNDTITIWD